jgi:ribosome-associated protein
MTLDEPLHDDAPQYSRPSKSQLKRESLELQILGQALLELPDAKLAAVPMPERLLEALQALRRTRSHEGRRRQLQYVGKLMRDADAEPLREAVAAQRLPGAKESLALHEAEAWRARLISSDNSLTEWLNKHPDVDAQALRNLIRNARRDAAQAASAQVHDGAVERKGRAFRELFQNIREVLAADARAQDNGDDEDAD